MGFCSSCGTSLSAAAKFCPACGTPAPTSDPGNSIPNPFQASAPPPPVAVRAASVGAPGPVSPVSPPAALAAQAAAGPAMAASPDGPAGGSVRAPVPHLSKWDSSHEQIIEGLKRLYSTKVRPLEAAYRFDHFFSPLLTDADFEAKPMVLLMGQYSVGKTSFIKFLLERDFPGQRIGPEPTTDRFVAVMHGAEERIIPGNALAVQADMPFRALQKHGMAFLNKFEASLCPAPILQKISFIDSPGVLSGEKQRIGRLYDFPEVVEWFAERADRILLLFDAHKLDISDEFKRAIESLRGHDDKIRVVLNKADMVTNQQLMRVYGALMWSLGKVIKTPEVLRVYIGSFWDREYANKENKALFEAEQNDLLADLRSLPRNSSVRKVNELVKRARCAKVHAHIIQHMLGKFGFFGKQGTQDEMLAKLPELFKAVHQATGLPLGDFPNPQRFRDAIQHFKIWEFPELSAKAVAAMDEVLAHDIPRLLQLVPQVDDTNNGGAGSVLNPFDDINAGVNEAWAVNSADKTRFDNIFYSLNLDGEKLRGADAKGVMMASGLGGDVLKKIWGLADLSKRGMLDAEEFAIAMHLIEGVQQGRVSADLPARLPMALIPPSKRHLVPHALHA